MITTATSPQLPLFAVPKGDCNVEWFVEFLRDRDWTTAKDVLRHLNWEVNEDNKRWVRALAEASAGRVVGHQKGYRLVSAMTAEEYQWWRNEWLKSAASIRWRVIQSDRVFYGRRAA